jgi:hypothetical protein
MHMLLKEIIMKAYAMAAASVALVSGLLSTAAQANPDVSWSVTIGSPRPAPRVVYAPPPVVYAPAPVVYAPAPVYAPPVVVHPQPVVYHPAPVVVHPRPVYQAYPVYYGHPHPGYRGHGHGHGHWKHVNRYRY